MALRHDVLSEDRCAASGRPHQTEDHADGGALTRAIGAEKADDLPAAHLQIEPIDRGERAEALHQSGGAENDIFGHQVNLR